MLVTAPAVVAAHSYTFVQPGSWGRYKDLPVLKDTVDHLLAMGVSVLRRTCAVHGNPPARAATHDA